MPPPPLPQPSAIDRVKAVIAARPWIIAAVVAPFGAFGLLLICLFGLPGDRPSRGNYPPPRTAYRGVTADRWFARAQDADGEIFDEAVRALRELGKEGVPYLIRLCRENDGHFVRLAMCIDMVDGRFVDTADLPFFTKFLDEKYKKSDKIRPYALHVLRMAGPRAASCLPSVKKLENEEGHLGRSARQTIKIIEGMSPEAAQHVQ